MSSQGISLSCLSISVIWRRCADAGIGTFHRLCAIAWLLLLKLPYFRGRNFFIRHVLAFARVAPSLYGPLMRQRADDWTNRAALFAYYGNDISSRIQTLKDGDMFVDIGANAGIFSLIAAGRVGDGPVFAFEPNPRVFSDLIFNIALNRADNIVPLNVALSDNDALVLIQDDRRHSGGGYITPLANKSTPSGKEGMTHVTTFALKPRCLRPLSREAGERQFGVKIDVEGHELQVLHGLIEAEVLESASWIIVEIDDSLLKRFGVCKRDIYELLANAGFKPTRGMQDTAHYDEVFTPTNAP